MFVMTIFYLKRYCLGTMSVLGEQMSEAVVEMIERPLKAGLEAVAEAALPPGDSYRLFRDWAASQGLCGHSGNDYPDWQAGIYVSTAITSGGLARQPDIGPAEAVSQNTDLASRLVDQLATDNGVNPRDILLSTDLPYVKGWKQSDYLAFWLANLAGLPRDAGVGDALIDMTAGSPPAMAMNDHNLAPEVRWQHYRALVELFDNLCQDIRLYNRNDYYQQCAPPGQIIQLVDATTSLGAQAEALYAGMRRLPVHEILVRTERVSDGQLLRSLGLLAATGGCIGTIDPAKAVVVISNPLVTR
jgi:hypothetical protein